MIPIISEQERIIRLRIAHIPFSIFFLLLPISQTSCVHSSQSNIQITPNPSGSNSSSAPIQSELIRNRVKYIIIDVHKMLPEITVSSFKIKILAGVAVLEDKIGEKEASKKSIQDALQILDSISEKDIALIDIAQAQMSIGDTESYKKTEKIMSKLSGEKFKNIANKVTPKEDNLTVSEISSIAVEGQIKRAKKGAEKLSEYEKPMALHYIVGAQADHGDIRGALQTANTITKEFGYQARAMEDIVSAQIEKGDEEGALKTVSEIDDVEGAQFRADAYWRIAVTSSAKGNSKTAANAILMGFNLTSKRPYIPVLPYFQVSELLSQAEKEFQKGDKLASEENIEKAAIKANEIKGVSDRRWALTEVIITKAMTGDVIGAVEFQKTFLTDDDPFTDLSLPYIAKGYLDSDSINESVQIARILMRHSAFGIHDPFAAKSALLLRISVALARTGNLDEALYYIGQVKLFSSEKLEVLSIIATSKGLENIDPTLTWIHRMDSPFEKASILLAIAESVLTESQGKN